MARSYKLRLGDGTVLVVDQEGLSSWLGDTRALVQPAGTELWKPLKQFLIQERAAARRAARQRPKPSSTSRDALPLVYPKPREKPGSGPPKGSIPVRADGLPLIPPPPPKPRDDPDQSGRRTVPAPPATVVRPSLPKPPAPPVLRKPTPPVAPPPPEAPPPPVPPKPPAVSPASATVTPPPSIVTPPAVLSAPPLIVPPPSIVELAPPIIELAPAIVEPAPPIIRSPPPVVTPAPASVMPAPPLIVTPPPVVSPKPSDDRDNVIAPSAPRSPVAAPAGPARKQPLAEKPATLSTESASPLLASGEDVDWMKLPKPLDDEPSSLPAVKWIDPLEASSANVRVSPASLRASSPQEPSQKARSGAPAAFEPVSGRVGRRDWQKTGRWLMSQAASAYGTLLASWRKPAHQDRPLASASPDEPALQRAVESERSAPPLPPPPVEVPLRAPVRAPKGKEQPRVYSPRTSTEDGLPVLQLVPLDDEKGPTDEVIEIDLEPLVDEALTLASKPSAPAAAKMPAQPVRERPAPRLAAPPPPKPLNEAHEAVPLRRTASPWTKRLAVMGGVVAAGLFAAISSENWIPKAVPSVRIVVSEADVVKQSRERLPHLAPETIRLVLDKSATGVLDAPAVFRVTSDAVDRGSWALTPEEVLELRALWRELLAALSPSEAERVLEYEGARARRATLPFENRAALDLVARGARALPSRSRTRLQALVGKAVAAQLRADGATRP